MKFEFKFPDIGEGIHEGVIIKWLVNVGDEINEGDSLAEVETDKVTTEIPSPKSGMVSELKGKKGDVINVGQVFVVINTSNVVETHVIEKFTSKAEIIKEDSAGVVGEVIASSEVIPSSREINTGSIPLNLRRTKVLATPVARKLAKDLGVDIQTVVGSGPSGRVMKEDIYKAKDQMETSQKGVSAITKAERAKDPMEDRIERIPLTRIRKTIAERMSQSKFTIPHTTAMDEVDISKLDELRRKYKDILKEEDLKLTYLPFIIKASIAALKEFPEFNSSLDEESDELILKHFYHIGIATDTERGLMVPVIREADRMTIVDLAKAIEDISTKAKENRIQLHDLKGSTFSITNYGSIGGYFGIPIINYPEAAILGLGRAVKKPIVKDDQIIIATILPLSLSYDHRTIDGASGARFLNKLKELLANPDMLLLRS
ncbi:2-oxo acid dehydrogenase subunit E2 [Tissierella creatinini]|nr:2-oxo acid dehydrogenase subunit E2 [Tissierella creatinini]TJX60384.1 2-oxo acid dehydrogenase subunit E2 [Soehngenia saccharolytica]